MKDRLDLSGDAHAQGLIYVRQRMHHGYAAPIRRDEENSDVSLVRIRCVA